MNRTILALLVLLAFSASAEAAYTTPTIGSADQLPDGRMHFIVVFSGDMGEATKLELFATSEDDLKSQCRAAIVKLNATAGALPKYVPGTVVDVTPVAVVTPPPPPQPTADQLAAQAFSGKIAVWRLAKQKLSFGIAMQSDVDAAVADIAATYNKSTTSQKALFDIILGSTAP